MNTGSNASRSQPWALGVTTIAFAGCALAQGSSTPAALEPTGGGGQIVLVDHPYPLAVSVRVTDSSGEPVAGVPVYFEVDNCSEPADGASGCPPQSAYPTFPGHAFDAVVSSEASGQAAAPPLTAGDIAGNFRIVASVYPDAGPFAVIHAYFPEWQIDASTAVPITSGFTGAWFDPQQSGNGLFVEVLPNSRMVAYWYAFTPNGAQAWFGGVGDIIGTEAVIYARQAQGGNWIPNFDPSRFTSTLWGVFTLTFADCNHGRVDFAGDGPWGTGHMDLTRITLPAGLSCP